MIQESINIKLSNEQKTNEFGRNLVDSLYSFPLTILLNGPVGAGKTTFLKGMAKGLRIEEELTSPTFALEQRYATKEFGEFIHLDLYRLSPEQAHEALRASEDFEGIRCIEWADKMPSETWKGHIITVTLSEEGDARWCEMAFGDIAIPSAEDVDRWRMEVMLQPHIIEHCETVARICDQLSAALLEKGKVVRPLAVHRGAQLHDLLRFLNFSAKIAPLNVKITPDQERTWSMVREQYGNKHESGCAQFMEEHGFPALARIIRPHGLTSSFATHPNVEELLLFYADKRSSPNGIVTIQQRLDDIVKRYAKDPEDPKVKEWWRMTKHIEDTLFADGPPTLF